MILNVFFLNLDRCIKLLILINSYSGESNEIDVSILLFSIFGSFYLVFGHF